MKGTTTGPRKDTTMRGIPHLTRRLAAVAAALALLPGLSACGGGGRPASETSPSSAGQRIAPDLTTMFRQALKNSKLTPFGREALQRAVVAGKISVADYEEAHRRYARCMADLGFHETYAKLPSGTYKINGSLPAGMDPKTFQNKYKEAIDKCSYPTLESLFNTQQNNPNLLANPFKIAVHCLVKAGAVGPDYTPDQLQAALNGDLAKAPFKVSDPRVKNCLAGSGMAVETDG